MSLILDLLLVAIIIICIIAYSRKGLISCLIGVGGFIFSLIGAKLLAPTVEGYIGPSVEKLIESKPTDSLSSVFEVFGALLEASSLSYVVSFAIAFVICSIALKIAEALLNLVFKLPLLKQINGALGALFGLLIGLFYSMVLSYALFAFAELLVKKVSWITPETFENSVVAKLLFEYNVFRFLF